MTKTADIHDLYFDAESNAFECELLPLQTLFGKQLNHRLTQPQRLHFYLVICITRGEGRHVVDFKEYTYRQGDIFFMAPGQIQQFEVLPDAEGVLLLFTPAFLKRDAADLSFLHQAHIFDITVANAMISPTGLAHDELQFLVQAMLTEFNRPRDWFSENMLRKYLSLFLFYCERVKRQQSPGPAACGLSADYYHFKQLVEAHFKQHRSVEFYASAMAVPPKRLTSITKALVGLTAKELIDDRVTLEIKRLLIHSNKSVKEIAHELAFDESTNLVKYFKKQTGQSPVHFKKMEPAYEEARLV